MASISTFNFIYDALYQSSLYGQAQNQIKKYDFLELNSKDNNWDLYYFRYVCPYQHSQCKI